MHTINNKPSILCLGSLDFNYSLNELKNHLDFDITFLKDLTNNNYNIILVDSDFLNDPQVLEIINSSKNKKKLLIGKLSKILNFKFDLIIDKPFSVHDLNTKIIKMFTSERFIQNSTVQIKDYILDKNEKKLKKDDKFIIITEKEIQLLELLFLEIKPLTKKIILNKIWNYSNDADTHTVETHIYRLRKKILNKFIDDKLMLNTREGYTI